MCSTSYIRLNLLWYVLLNVLGTAFLNTVRVFGVTIVTISQLHQDFRLYKATVCVYIFLELSDLPADWNLDGGLGCVHIALVMYTQAHTDAKYRARRNTVVFSNQTDSKLENKHLGPSLTSSLLSFSTCTYSERLIQSFFDATACPCLVSIDQQRFFSHVTYFGWLKISSHLNMIKA